MRTLNPTELQLALKRKPKVIIDEDKPDFTSADDSNERAEPSVMPSGQDNSIFGKEG